MDRIKITADTVLQDFISLGRYAYALHGQKLVCEDEWTVQR